MDNGQLTLVVTNAALEILMTQFGDEVISFSTTIANGLVVGVCSALGGLLGGRYGILIGGSIGTYINTKINQRVITIRELMQQIDFTSLQSLFVQITNGIRYVVTNVLHRMIDSNMNIYDLLIMFIGNSEVRSRIIQVFTEFFSKYQNLPQIKA